MKMKINDYIFIDADKFLWGNKEFAIYILPEFSIGHYSKCLHFEFAWLFWVITISIRIYKYD